MSAFLVVLTLWSAPQAAAQSDPVTEAAGAIRAIVRSPDPDVTTLDEVLERLWADVPKLEAPVDDRVWADLLLDLTVARYQLGRDWKAPRLAAAWTRPDLSVPVGPSLAELRDWVPPQPEDAAPLPYGRVLTLDGRRRDTLPALRGMHLVQGTRCGVWSSDLVEGSAASALRAAWLAECPAPGWRSRDLGLVAGGAGLVVAGVVAAVVSYALARPGADATVPTVLGAPVTRRTRAALVGANAAGWASVGVGAGLAVPGGLLRARQVRRARARP